MNEDDYEMSQFVIGFDGGGGSDQYDGINDGSNMEEMGSQLYFGSPPPPKFLLGNVDDMGAAAKSYTHCKNNCTQQTPANKPHQGQPNTDNKKNNHQTTTNTNNQQPTTDN